MPSEALHAEEPRDFEAAVQNGIWSSEVTYVLLLECTSMSWSSKPLRSFFTKLTKQECHSSKWYVPSISAAAEQTQVKVQMEGEWDPHWGLWALCSLWTLWEFIQLLILKLHFLLVLRRLCMFLPKKRLWDVGNRTRSSLLDWLSESTESALWVQRSMLNKNGQSKVELKQLKC